ncbi:MAG: helix-turn-helix domain-containing protein [Lachnospiraceae bacterium]|nr:helix-turn-helix domain-containing protein [Lachnospiraceae bacterium]
MNNYSYYNYDASEHIKYDNPEFPVYVKEELLSYYPDFITTAEWHNDMEFDYILSGNMTFVVEGVPVPVYEGQGIFINSHRVSHAFNAEKQECEYIRVLLNPSLLTANSMFEMKYLKPFTSVYGCSYVLLTEGVSWQAEILNTVKKLLETKGDRWSDFAIQILYMRVFELLYFNTSSHPTAAPDAFVDVYALKNMLLYIVEHYTEKVTLDDIAASAGCKKSKCTQLFKDFLDTAPINYLSKYRLSKALGLLTETNRTIARISYDLGFNNGSSYFCESFKKTFGMSAAEYRKIARARMTETAAPDTALELLTDENPVNMDDIFEDVGGSAEANQSGIS